MTKKTSNVDFVYYEKTRLHTGYTIKLQNKWKPNWPTDLWNLRCFSECYICELYQFHWWVKILIKSICLYCYAAVYLVFEIKSIIKCEMQYKIARQISSKSTGAQKMFIFNFCGINFKPDGLCFVQYRLQVVYVY